MFVYFQLIPYQNLVSDFWAWLIKIDKLSDQLSIGIDHWEHTIG